MLSIFDTGNKPWDEKFRELLSSRQMVAESQVRQLFAEGVCWADENNFERKRYRDSDYYADQYFRTAARRDPVIPKFMRRYIAHELGFRCKEDLRTVPPPVQVQQIPAHAS